MRWCVWGDTPDQRTIRGGCSSLADVFPSQNQQITSPAAANSHHWLPVNSTRGGPCNLWPGGCGARGFGAHESTQGARDRELHGCAFQGFLAACSIRVGSHSDFREGVAPLPGVFSFSCLFLQLCWLRQRHRKVYRVRESLGSPLATEIRFPVQG